MQGRSHDTATATTTTAIDSTASTSTATATGGPTATKSATATGLCTWQAVWGGQTGRDHNACPLPNPLPPCTHPLPCITPLHTHAFPPPPPSAPSFTPPPYREVPVMLYPPLFPCYFQVPVLVSNSPPPLSLWLGPCHAIPPPPLATARSLSCYLIPSELPDPCHATLPPPLPWLLPGPCHGVQPSWGGARGLCPAHLLRGILHHGRTRGGGRPGTRPPACSTICLSWFTPTHRHT